MTDRKKFWSYSAGERGRNRVRAYEDTSGKLLLEFYVESDRISGRRKRKRVSLPHRDRAQAKAQADELAARFARQPAPKPAEEISVGELFDNYISEVTPGKSEGKQRHDRACARMFGGFFGVHRTACSLNARDWERFKQDREAGRVGPDGNPKPVRNRQIEYDLRWLLAVLNWGCLNAELEKNPLNGLKLPKEKSPKRVVLAESEYRALRSVAKEVDWRFELALVLAHETGHRIGSIRQLRWSDIDLTGAMILWRAEADKSEREHETPLTKEAVAAIRTAARNHLGIGEAWLLPSPMDATKPCDRYLPRKWWKRAEQLGGT